MNISIAKTRFEKILKQGKATWDKFRDRISKTKRTPETLAEFRKMPKAQQDSIKDIGGFVLGELAGGRRKKDCVLSRSGLTLDMDYATGTVIDGLKMLFDFKCYVYSTHKHTPKHPRYRLIIPLLRDVTPDEYMAVARKMAEKIGIEMFDGTTYDPSRLMYWPSTSADGDFVFEEIEGPLLDPDAVLVEYNDWRDTSEWPVSQREQAVMHRALKKQADPMTKGGVIGAFCRAYSIEEAIGTFLSDVYAPSAVNGRYDYIPADSAAGVVTYEGRFSYSHHATDPLCDQLLNAFDLVRLHKFGALDANSPPGTSASKLPSFKAMIDFALKDKRTLDELDRKRQAKVSADGGDWKYGLERGKSGDIKNTLRNIISILENDPNLKALVFNQLADGMEIKGEVPWQHPSRFWRDADDAQLITFIDANYGAFSARNYQIAVTKVTDDRSYHPILEFLERLPEWDGVERVETLLIDYLGAEDTPYVRAVTRKTLCAAIMRVRNPGIKFDTILVLQGPQGTGKSTLLEKLGGEWFSDSLHLSDTRDKTAAEKLQGYWILEISELSGLQKADENTLRAFISRQNDIYRAAFGRRATGHPRQCIFVGTTNSQFGYLRDNTGNRRYWPVRTSGGARKRSWDMSVEEVQQIWAEALAYVEKGEKLILDADLDCSAKLEQQEAVEFDDREGLVRMYLDTLLPDDWDSLTLFKRRDFLHGEGKRHLGTVQRTSVSCMEVWCECFERHRADLHRAESNEIISILQRIGWQRAEKKVRLPLYGPQYVYVPPTMIPQAPTCGGRGKGDRT